LFCRSIEFLDSLAYSSIAVRVLLGGKVISKPYKVFCGCLCIVPCDEVDNVLVKPAVIQHDSFGGGMLAVNVYTLLDTMRLYVHELKINGLLGAVDLVDVVEALEGQCCKVIVLLVLGEPREAELF